MGGNTISPRRESKGDIMPRLLGLVLVVALVLSGCVVRSLTPIYTTDDLVFVPEIEGTWNTDQDGETMSFVRDDDGYIFSYVEGDEQVSLSAHFARIGKKTYLDLTIHDDNAWKGPYGMYATPVHMFYEAEVRDKVLRMRAMDNDWVKERREKGRLWIDHVVQDDTTLLTADTARVQRFIRHWANTDEAWGDWNELPLVPAATPAVTK